MDSIAAAGLRRRYSSVFSWSGEPSCRYTGGAGAAGDGAGLRAAVTDLPTAARNADPLTAVGRPMSIMQRLYGSEISAIVYSFRTAVFAYPSGDCRLALRVWCVPRL